MDAATLFGQLASLPLVPLIVIADMAITTTAHTVLLSFLAGLGAFGTFMTVFLSLGVFVSGLVFCYFWVSTAAFGLLRVRDA